MKRMKMEKVGTFVLIGLLLLGAVGIASAQQPLPTGGDSFDTAVTIEPGSYEGVGLIEKDVKEYFYINVKPGQELKLEGTLNAFSDSWGEETLGLYNENREKLVEVVEALDKGQQEVFSFSWLTNADKDSYKYYIKRECTWHKIESLSLDISLTNRYDAGSQTDAGDFYDTALNVTAGDYDGYMAGGKHGSEPGDDDEDYYMISLGSGQLLDVTVAPPDDASFWLKIYDQNRVEKASTNSANAGAITSTSWTAPSAQDVYVAITNIGGLSANGGTYSLSLSFEAAPGKAALTVKTTPVNGGVYVDGTLWGTAPQTRSVDPDTYTISFEYVSGYTTPSSQLVNLVAGDSETVTGTYTEIDTTDGDGDEGGGTPGFETLAVIAAIGVALIILRRRK